MASLCPEAPLNNGSAIMLTYLGSSQTSEKWLLSTFCSSSEYGRSLHDNEQRSSTIILCHL